MARGAQGQNNTRRRGGDGDGCGTNGEYDSGGTKRRGMAETKKNRRVK